MAIKTQIFLELDDYLILMPLIVLEKISSEQTDSVEYFSM